MAIICQFTLGGKKKSYSVEIGRLQRVNAPVFNTVNIEKNNAREQKLFWGFFVILKGGKGSLEGGKKMEETVACVMNAVRF